MKHLSIWIAAALASLALVAIAGALPAGEKGLDAKVDEPARTAKAELGKPAPDFELKDLDGKVVKLSDHKGKIVVLEWFNPECPFVVRNYGENGSLRGQAARLAKDGVVWISINSGAEGKQGTGIEKNRKAKTSWKMEHALLLDEKGEVGRRYEAKTTPHMYVIDAKGVLVYRGAIDNAPSGKPEADEKLVNYVDAAIADLKAGKPVAKADTKAYGCSVKY
ncbi:MAG: thioredoxin family protein [Planctomycetes bacterium]|nr:thioredoxin family protein [Planctomycetota bacterium]